MTIPSHISDYLQNRDWTYGGTIAREVGYLAQSKESNVERRLREMTEDETLETRYVPNPKGKGAPVVMYRLKRKVEQPCLL